MNFTPHQYITNWHDSFVDYIGSLLGLVAGLMARPEAKEAHLTSSFFPSYIRRLAALQIPVIEG